MAVASMVVLFRVLMDNRLLDTLHGHVAVGWLVVEDLFTVVALVLIPAAPDNTNSTTVHRIARYDRTLGFISFNSYKDCSDLTILSTSTCDLCQQSL